jgi:hypothetical protein
MVLSQLNFSGTVGAASPVVHSPRPHGTKAGQSNAPPTPSSPSSKNASAGDQQAPSPKKKSQKALAPQAPDDDEIMETIETDESGTAVPDADDEGGTVLDPKKSARQYWSDPATRVQREIWRPGDGDGDKTTDYYGKPGALAPLEQRWRFYQSRTGVGPIKRGVNEPPKYVILDDRTAYECYISDIPRQYLKQFWEHDFGGAGAIRVRRPHRGRGAVGDADAPGDDRFQFVNIGGKGDKYYFTGEKNYKPIIYQTKDQALAIQAFKPAKRGPPSPPPKKALPANKHGHNQFTPKDKMVKYGAPHKGTTWLRYRNRLNPFLTRDKSPPGRHRYGMSVLHSRNPAEAMELPSAVAQQDIPQPEEAEQEDDGLWMDSGGERAAKRQKTGSAYAPLELGTDEEDEEEEAIDMGNTTTGEDSPVSPKPTESSGADLEVVRPQRQKLVEQSDYFAEMLDQQAAGNIFEDIQAATASMGHEDSGSYASRLEAELSAARMVIEQQRNRISELENALKTAKDNSGEFQA